MTFCCFITEKSWFRRVYYFLNLVGVWKTINIYSIFGIMSWLGKSLGISSNGAAITEKESALNEIPNCAPNRTFGRQQQNFVAWFQC